MSACQAHSVNSTILSHPRDVTALISLFRRGIGKEACTMQRGGSPGKGTELLTAQKVRTSRLCRSWEMGVISKQLERGL